MQQGVSAEQGTETKKPQLTEDQKAAESARQELGKLMGEAASLCYKNRIDVREVSAMLHERLGRVVSAGFCNNDPGLREVAVRVKGCAELEAQPAEQARELVGLGA